MGWRARIRLLDVSIDLIEGDLVVYCAGEEFAVDGLLFGVHRLILRGHVTPPRKGYPRASDFAIIGRIVSPRALRTISRGDVIFLRLLPWVR